MRDLVELLVSGRVEAEKEKAASALHMILMVELERETDGRWIAEVPELPGVLVYGVDENEALSKVKAFALRVIADRLEHGEATPDLADVSFRAAA